MTSLTKPFHDPQAVARYAEGPPRMVPGFADLQRMALLLLSEAAPDDARLLILGAGGGLELEAFAKARPAWRFDGVDPSAAMLRLAEARLGPLASRACLHEGTIDDAPEGPFDGAACLLTLHFLPHGERRRTVAEVRRRLKAGARFVVAHHSIPHGEAERRAWLSRFAAFAASSGIEPERAHEAATGIGRHLPLLAPEQDETLLREAGFAEVGLFYAAFTFRGWVATNP